MVRRNYVGFVDPEAEFAKLRPYREELIRMMQRYRPFGPEFCALLAAQEALDEAAVNIAGHKRMFVPNPLGHRS